MIVKHGQAFSMILFYEVSKLTHFIFTHSRMHVAGAACSSKQTLCLHKIFHNTVRGGFMGKINKE